MVKSLEQYLSDMNFADPGAKEPKPVLSAQERIFVEKYLGMDALDAMPRVEPTPQEVYLKPVSPGLKFAEPEIQVARPEIVIAPEKEEKSSVAEEPKKEKAEEALPSIDRPSQNIKSQVKLKECEPEFPEVIVASNSDDKPVQKKEPPLPKPAPNEPVPEAKPEISPVLPDSLREQENIQVVSFFVAGQLFLLPVSGIQEVLRRMELVRVPQAPEFMAGAINLRGKVTPLVHLSALLTNETEYKYDSEKNFIIICGTENMQIGLIIDKINSMHVIPHNKFIWNAEAKLGEAAEFLFAIADLDDRVCGVVSPDTIIKKIAAS